jgi:NitT/TauT family transport system substrate-binding protein
MKRTPSLACGVIVLFAMVLGGFCPNVEAKADKITILMNWTIDGQHAPFFVAWNKGFFAAKNIEVQEIFRGQGSNDTVSKIITGSADFGFAHSIPIIQAIAANQPVKIVMGFYTDELCQLYTTEDNANVRTIEDLARLKNAKYGGPPSDLCYQMLEAISEATGKDLSNIKLVNVTPDARIALLARGQIDMAGTYYTGETAFRKGVEQAGKKLVTMRYDKYIQVYGNVMLVNTKLLKENSDLVQRFVTALLRGLKYTVDNPGEAEQIMLKYQAQLDKSFNHDSLTAMVKYAIWDETTKSKGVGMIDAAKMNNTIKTIAKFWKLERVPTAEESFTNQFVLTAQKELGK